MSVVIYKGGERSKCEPHELTYQLDDGWSLTDGSEEVEDELESENIETPDESEESTEDHSDYCDIRLEAKAKGIRNWHNKKPETLEKELAELEKLDGDQE